MAKNTDFEEANPLSNNDLAFIALCNEYCSAVENAAMSEQFGFIDTMLRLLPRLYISANDLKSELFISETSFIPQALDENTYDQLRLRMAALFGEDDTFLEVFEEDMKYSDTPIAASVSESLADLFQVFFDFLEACRDVPNQIMKEAIAAVRESFADFWSQTLVNVLRALNSIKYR